MASGYKFPILNSNGSVSTTVVDFDDMFVSKGQFLTSGLYSWGFNRDGGLGLLNVADRSSPVQVGSLTNWRQVSAGVVGTTAIKTDGTLWAWGSNNNGYLGIGDVAHRSSPVQVGSLTNWRFVASGRYHTAAISNTNALWTWGRNIIGGLGLGDTTNRSSPVQVGVLTDWKLAAGGTYYTAAIKTDGTLWTWGQNGEGQLGLLDTTNRSSPVQVGLLTGWKQVACGVPGDFTAAIKTNGTLWLWGRNTYGSLGLGDTTNRSSPVQVGLLTNWKQVVACSRDHTAAIKTDGTLWLWGRNNYGQLGLNDTVHRSSPVQVGSLTNWKQVSMGFYYTAAIKTDGTLWTWGQNPQGQLGLGDLVHRSSPVQVGSLTNWKQLIAGAGGFHVAAISSPDLP